jgi:hypothetical protein
MKRHLIDDDLIRQMGGQPVTGFKLCIYESEPLSDLWRGWMAAEAGWSGGQTLPGMPVSSYGEALAGWVAKHPNPSGAG